MPFPFIAPSEVIPITVPNYHRPVSSLSSSALHSISFRSKPFHSMENMPSTSSSAQTEIENAAISEIVPFVRTSRPSIHCPYAVFINHHGKDVKDTLASYIYYALEALGICVFLDKHSMEAGESITAQIEDAIRSASVHIAIFSQNYAASRWCLEELCLMMEISDNVLPVFYDVDPCDLRWMGKDGPYAEAFRIHQEKKRYDSHTLEKWKKALSDAAGRSGYELKKRFNGGERALVKHIVNDVLKRVKREPLYVAKHPVGLDEVEEEFETTMLLRAADNAEENVQVVGIVGMGGVGKTTLAVHLFNTKRSDYGRSSCLLDVRSCNSLTVLQRQLLKDLTGVDEEIHNTRQGIGSLRRQLLYCQALVILDDIDHVDQLEALLVVKDVLRSGSLILVTSRDKGLLRDSQILSLYDMRRLSERHAQELFCLHAFLRPFPTEGFEEFVERFLIACDGLPLSLKVFGALVYGKNITYWKSQLEKISVKPKLEVKDRLKVSYDALHKDDQEMFLDVACFFIGEEKGKVIRIWDGCGWNGLDGLENLQNKSLIEFDNGDCIRMHDQLRDMGRDIVDEESNNPRRLWRPDDVIDLQRRSRTKQLIRGIRSTASPVYDKWRLLNMELKTPRFTRYRGCKEVLRICVEFICRLKFETCGSWAGEGELKLLVLEGDCFKGICSSASTGLVWLRWYNCPYRSLPLWLYSMEQLRVLEVFGRNIHCPWHASQGIPTQLRELNMRACPLKFPKYIGQLKFLEKIVLCAGKETADNMKALPDEFCRLQLLKHLELLHFGQLELLPQNFGDLTNLQYLDLRRCKSLQALPDSFNRLLQLQYLCLEACRSLSFGQDTFRNILTLKHVDFSYCKSLEVLPIQIRRQASLEKLYLMGTSLTELPNEIEDLRNLKVLELGSPWLRSLPTSIWNLSSLISLKLHGSNLKRLTQDDADDPTSSRGKYLRGRFQYMRNLEDLDVQHCPLSEGIPFTSAVRNLEKEETVSDLRDSAGLFPKLKRLCFYYTEIPSISIAENVCPSITSLSIGQNIHLVEVGVLPKALESLDLGNCSVLKRIEGLSHLVKLFKLDIAGCRELEELPNVAESTSLERLNADGCWKLKRIKGLERLKRLKELYISAGKDNGTIWNDIQFLQRLPYSKLSTTSLTTRAVPGVESRVQTIFGSLASRISPLKFITENYRSIRVFDIKSVSTMMVCILFDGSSRDDYIDLRYERPPFASLSHEVFGEEGECISMLLFPNDTYFVRNLKAYNVKKISVHASRGMEVRKGWIVMARDGEEESKILETWNRVLSAIR